MSEKVEKAKELFLEGYNCCQSVVGAFCDDVGIDFNTSVKLASSFGAGMGRLREVCGAVTGIFIVIGLKYGYTSATDKDAKSNHYKLVQDIAKEFKHKNNSIICRELLNIKKDTKESYIPDDRTNEYYKVRPCVAMVEDAAMIAEKILSGDFTI